MADKKTAQAQQLSELTKVKTWRDTIHKEMLAMSKEVPQDFAVDPSRYHAVTQKIGHPLSQEARMIAQRHLKEIKDEEERKRAASASRQLPMTTAQEVGFLASGGAEMNSTAFKAIRERCAEVKFSELFVAATGRTPTQRDPSAGGSGPKSGS